MRIAIVHLSIHHHNTESIAKAMADSAQAELIPMAEIANHDLTRFELLGIGSGIFFGMHHTRVLRFAEESPYLPNKCFVFSTAGIRWIYRLWHYPLVRILENRGCEVIGQFCSPGWDTVGPLKYIGGIHRGRPKARDLEQARQFARRIVTS
ncbi:hypothetical protein SH501x_003721 [Pirellulaceae bacterium SH501]